MYYRMLGNTGLQVSVLSYGFWATYGVKDDLTEDDGIAMAKQCLSLARKAGVNLFDNAEAYGNPVGEAERIMGEALSQLADEDPETWRRSDILITTKIFWGGAGVNEKGLSRKHIMEGLDAGIERLQVDYVDLVFCHRRVDIGALGEQVYPLQDVDEEAPGVAPASLGRLDLAWVDLRVTQIERPQLRLHGAALKAAPTLDLHLCGVLRDVEGRVEKEGPVGERLSREAHLDLGRAEVEHHLGQA